MWSSTTTSLAAMTLLLQIAAPTCPDATWTAAPTNVSSSWLNTCYKSSAAVSNLGECFDACTPGRPACLSSAEETRFILEHVPFILENVLREAHGIHFIGDRLTNKDTATLQCDGSPSAPWLVNAQWEDQPGKYHGCALMVPSGGFGASYEPSDGAGVEFYNMAATLQSFKVPCLCATSSVVAASSAKNETLAWVAAQREEMVNDATTWAIVMLAVMALFVLLPSVYICVRYRASRSAGDADCDSPLDTKTMLQNASSSAAKVRVRVSGALFWIGWLLLVVSLVPDVVNNVARQVLSMAGMLWVIFPLHHTFMAPWGMCLMLLAILPTDVSAIRCVPFVLLAIFCFLLLIFAASALSSSTEIDFFHPVEYWFIMIAWIYQIILTATLICALLPTIRCCCCESHRMTPRAALNRMWLTLRCFLTGTSVPPAAYVICAALAPDFGHDVDSGLFILYAVSYALAGFTFKPANRGRIRRLLGSLGGKGSSEQEAAAIAALVGGRSPAETLALATSKFRMLTTDLLAPSDLTSSKDTGMYARTTHVALGECAAFLSHSWQDDVVAKYEALNAWSIRQKADERSIWLDKACIDQHANIEDQLVALPIFLSGCKQLLIIAGPTYASRLWCTMEVFTFVRMNGGEHQHIVVEPIAGATLQTLAKFDGGKAQCFDPKDRSHLLAVIESGMGDIRYLNRMVRAIFTAKAKGAGLGVEATLVNQEAATPQGKTDARQVVTV